MHNKIKHEDKFKIAFVVVSTEMAGAQQISLDILSSINDTNVEKYIICGEITEENIDFVNAFHEANVEIISIPCLKRNIGFSDIAAFLALYSVFKLHKFNVVHTNSTKPAIVARIAAKLAGIKKIVHTVHGIAFHKHVSLPSRAMFYLIENFSTLFGDHNISVNNYYKKYYPLVRTQVIHNGVNFEKLNFKTKKEKQFINFAFMARLDQQKNPLEFLEAAKLFSDSYSGDTAVRFTMAGSGPLAKECEEYIKANNLSDIVSMVGWVHDKSEFYTNVDVLCQPSYWEAFGLVFVEAAYFAIPSIARNVEGIPEVIKDNETGMLYSGGASDLCACIHSYVSNTSLIKSHGHSAKSHVENNFSVEKMTSRYKEIYGIDKKS